MKFIKTVLPALMLTMLAVTANAQNGCYAPPAGLVSWWPGEGNANDIIGGNNGTLVGGVTFTSGEVGQAFSFGSGYVSVPHVPAWDFGTNDFTIEFWANFTSPGGAQSFIACDDGSGLQNSKWIFFYGYGVNGLTFLVNISNGALATIGNFPFSPDPGQWYHITITRSGSVWIFYVNGAAIGTDTATVTVPSMSAPLTIGNAEGQFYFNGLLDEVSIYHRALASNEVAAIYAAGSAGKCVVLPPVIVVQPTNQIATAGNPANFAVSATGTAPLNYQWLFNGITLTNGGEVSGPTTTNLVLSATTTNDTGNYTVVITNAYGSATSAVATLTINVSGGPPGCDPPPGLVSWWPGEGNANDIIGGNNGTLVGGVTFTSGEVGQAFSFDGSSGYVSVPHVPAWDFGTNEFTIEFWANFTSPGGAQSFIACDDGATGLNKWIFFHGYGLDGLTFHLNGTPGNLTIGNFPFSPVAGQWYHIALTRSGPAWTFYVNGAAIGTDPSSAVVPSMSQPLTIGNAEGNFYFNGLLDEVSIYNRALSSNEIAAIYSAGSAGKCNLLPLAPLIASLNLAGTNLVINAANGVAGGTYTVLMSTNVALPLGQWTPVATNVLTGSGNFTITATNAVSPGASQQFYILQTQ